MTSPATPCRATSTTTARPAALSRAAASPAPAGDGIDAANNNTGAGAGGQDNVFTVAPAGTILNGPQGQPGAVGPTDNNDDFTDASAPVPAGTAPGSTVSPAPVPFTDTVNNPGATVISNTILLVPQSPSVLPGGSPPTCPAARR